MMALGLEFFRQVADSANVLAGGSKFQAVRLMAITATYPLVIHFALEEGTIDINLVLNLPVWIVKDFI